MRLPQANSNTHRSLITALSVLLAYFIGLVLAIIQVPGVPAVFVNYVWNNTPALFLSMGIPVTIAPFVVNFIINYLFRSKSIATY